MMVLSLLLGLLVAALILVSPKPIERAWARLVRFLERVFAGSRR